MGFQWSGSPVTMGFLLEQGSAGSSPTEWRGRSTEGKLWVEVVHPEGFSFLYQSQELPSASLPGLPCLDYHAEHLGHFIIFLRVVTFSSVLQRPESLSKKNMSFIFKIHKFPQLSSSQAGPNHATFSHIYKELLYVCLPPHFLGYNHAQLISKNFTTQ